MKEATKRKNCAILVILFALALVAFSGCNQGNKPPNTSSSMLSPRVISFGNFITWDKVEYATDYEIYCDGKLTATTQKNTYTLSNSVDSEYYVVAINTKTNEKTDKSNVVLSSKNCDFLQSEILDLTNINYYSALIPATVRKVIINSDYFNLHATLERRSTDIYFELNNAYITGYLYTVDGSYKRADNDYNVIFNVTGSCRFAGEKGTDGFDYSDSVYNNKEINAGHGYDGGSPLIVPSVVICGSGNFSISGGNGGKGGTGSATTTWESVNGPGAGADGGDGGTAIKCSYLVVDMDNSSCQISIRDGIGGQKGNPGKNGSIITGPMASAMWKDMYDIGKDGKNGKSVIGSRRVLKGVLDV